VTKSPSLSRHHDHLRTPADRSTKAVVCAAGAAAIAPSFLYRLETPNPGSETVFYGTPSLRIASAAEHTVWAATRRGPLRSGPNRIKLGTPNRKSGNNSKRRKDSACVETIDFSSYAQWLDLDRLEKTPNPNSEHFPMDEAARPYMQREKPSTRSRIAV